MIKVIIYNGNKIHDLDYDVIRHFKYRTASKVLGIWCKREAEGFGRQISQMSHLWFCTKFSFVWKKFVNKSCQYHVIGAPPLGRLRFDILNTDKPNTLKLWDIDDIMVTSTNDTRNVKHKNKHSRNRRRPINIAFNTKKKTTWSF